MAKSIWPILVYGEHESASTALRWRSCTFFETPHSQQIPDAESWCRDVLAGYSPAAWLPAAIGAGRDFRNRLKLAGGGSAGAVTLGILDQDFHGVDLRECGIQAPQIRAIIPTIGQFLNDSGLAPYDVEARRGELKFVHLTAAPAGDLMIRFVVRTQHGLEALRPQRDELIALIPTATVISVNLLPEHKAVLEGSTVEFNVGGATEFAEVTLTTGERPDCVIVTPPRRGIGARLSPALEISGIEHIVHSSCNPITPTKNLDRMPSYTVERARVFDMFPHTQHLEVAVVLRRRSHNDDVALASRRARERHAGLLSRLGPTGEQVYQAA